MIEKARWILLPVLQSGRLQAVILKAPHVKNRGLCCGRRGDSPPTAHEEVAMRCLCDLHATTSVVGVINEWTECYVEAPSQ